MTDDEIRKQVLDCLGQVAPEIDPASIDPRRPLRDQLDIDSMDFLRFVIELDERLHVAVPEAEYPQIATLDGCIRYLSARLARTPAN